jgi:DNA polymerase III subunit epsilon
MRQIILDTETTGLIPEDGHRIVEIGGIELIDRQFTGNNFHQYINPERQVEKGALEVHGISNEFLADKPKFAEIMPKFVDYIKDAELIIHNAPFDVGFLNYEFRRVEESFDPVEKLAGIFDTLALARKKHPGKKNNLDALCKRYGVDNRKRDFHGALLDARLLAEVFLAMTGGQMSLFSESDDNVKKTAKTISSVITPPSKQKIIFANPEEEYEHTQLLDIISKASKSNCLWMFN